MIFNQDPITLIYLAIIFVISITVHEFAHARSSNKLGDPTPRLQGRLTLDPRSHIDPVGLIAIFLIGFGRGRAVIINPQYYKNRLRDELLVALAGPASNIVLAICSVLILGIYGVIVGKGVLVSQTDQVVFFWKYFGIINCALAVFNMIPIPPLDGYRIINFFFPSVQVFFLRYQRYFSIALLALIFLPRFLGVPNFFGQFISTVSTSIYGIIWAIFSGLFFW